MNKEEYFKYHADCCARMVEITKAKNADYTGVGDNPFANFTRVELLGNCSTEQGFVTRMIDKISRIISFVQKGILEVKDESVEDTLIDLANYCILFSGYIKHKKMATTKEVLPEPKYQVIMREVPSYGVKYERQNPPIWTEDGESPRWM